MTEIKICGITKYEDALAAAELGVDALGFIFYPQSPRYIGPESAKAIIEGLAKKFGEKEIPPNYPVTIGVFVNHTLTDVKTIRSFCGLDMVQLHGDESVPYCLQFPAAILIKSFTPAMKKDPASLRDFPAKAIILDTRDGDIYGGTGKKSDWELAKEVKEIHPLILAGGLNEINVREAMEKISPPALDINSGIEEYPGKKNLQKLGRIVKLIRAIDRTADKQVVKIFSRQYPTAQD